MSYARHVTACRAAILVALATIVVADAAHAQVREPIRITASAAANQRADTLEARLEPLLGSPARWLEAARMQRRAAELRGDDPRAAASWARAAWFYAGARQFGTSRQMLERSAEHAIAGGDVQLAAKSWIDAALVALEDGREDLVPGYVGRTRRVLSSPLLTAQQRDTILQRIDGAPRLAVYFAPGR